MLVNVLAAFARLDAAATVDNPKPLTAMGMTGKAMRARSAKLACRPLTVMWWNAGAGTPDSDLVDALANTSYDFIPRLCASGG